MSEQHEVLQVEGIVHLRSIYFLPHPWSLGVEIESNDATWEIDASDDRSPYLAFAERRVVIAGEPQETPRCHRLQRVGGKPHRYLRISAMRLDDVTPEAEIIEVGAERRLTGRFELDANDTGETTLRFVTEQGDTFLVANDPAGATLGRNVEVRAFPVQPSPAIARAPEQFLWIVPPCSGADHEEWRERLHSSFARDFSVDADSGKLRRRQASAGPAAEADRPRD